jgi:hypothetical protein
MWLGGRETSSWRSDFDGRGCQLTERITRPGTTFLGRPCLRPFLRRLGGAVGLSLKSLNTIDHLQLEDGYDRLPKLYLYFKISQLNGSYISL